MELALAAKKASARGALVVAARQLLLPIAFGYGVAYIVPACISFASPPVIEEPRSSTFVHGSGSQLYAELVCESARPRLRERSPCNFPQ
jgi:hypothetical protein